jgi:hypothetical protein
MNTTATALPAGHSRNAGTVSDAYPPAAVRYQVHGGYPPHHNEATTLSQCQTVTTQHARCASHQSKQIAIGWKQRPTHSEPFIDRSTQIHGAGAMKHDATKVPHQHQPGAPQLRESSSQRTAEAPLPAPHIVVKFEIDDDGLRHLLCKPNKPWW